MRHKPTKEERAKRHKARWMIVWAARVHSLRTIGTDTTHNMKRLNWAVFSCRQNNLVKPEVLREAGFNG